jgi:hypothetical protein
MDGKDMKEGAKPPRRARRLAATGLVVSGLLAGGILAGSQVANAASTSPTSSASTSAASSDPNVGLDPTTMRHGPGETLLTDGTASKVKAAALAAVPGGTVIRVETDSAGSPYEAHVEKSDGSIVTVKVDDSFNVTTTESGFGAGGPMSANGSNA